MCSKIARIAPMFTGSTATFAGILKLMVARRPEEAGMERAGDAHGPGHFPRSLLYAAAKMYYDEDGYSGRGGEAGY